MMNRNAFTLVESLIVMVIISLIYSAICSVVRPSDIRDKSLKKAGSSIISELDFASKQILMHDSINYNFRRLKDENGNEFNIVDDDANQKLSKLFKKNLKIKRTKRPSTKYLAIPLRNEQGVLVNNLKINSFSNGFFLANNTYLAISLNKSCAKNETHIYDPARRDKRNQPKSCGLLFFDVNGENLPNILGVDQYIVSVGRMGLK